MGNHSQTQGMMSLAACEVQTQMCVGKESLVGALGNLGEITSHHFPIHKMENKIPMVSSFIFKNVLMDSFHGALNSSEEKAFVHNRLRNHTEGGTWEHTFPKPDSC